MEQVRVTKANRPMDQLVFMEGNERALPLCSMVNQN